MAAAPDLDLQPDQQAMGALAWAHPVVQEWFLARFGSATEPQEQGWPAILAGETTLISAPTGSGKTLAAFLVAIDQLLRLAIAGSLAPTTAVVYVSPLKALSQRRAEEPGAAAAGDSAARAGARLSVRRRSAPASAPATRCPAERARMLRNPPHILVTTPESLYLLLTAARVARASAPRATRSSSTRSTPSPMTSAARISR